MNLLKTKGIIAMICFAFAITSAAAQRPVSQPAPIKTAVQSDSDSLNFVRASIVVTTPGDAIYSVFGHCALRMTCPSAGLDYCFSLEMEPVAGNYIRFFAGRAKAAMIAVPAEEYIGNYRKEGRGITQYELNLTLPEKRLLWKNLDDDMMQGAVHKFNLINTNCVSESFMAIMNSLITDSIQYDKVQAVFSLKNGERLRYYCSNNPWAELLFITLTGVSSDQHAEIENTLSPTTIVELLQGSRLVDVQSGSSRPVFRFQPVTILKPTLSLQKSPLSPNVTFAIILAFVIIVTILDKRCGWHKLAGCTDVTLFVFQTAIGALLTFMALSSNLFGSRWNWYLVPFNVIPALLWLTCRKRQWYPHCYTLYTIILVLFILTMPLSTQFDVAHALIIICIAVRTGAHIKWRKLKKNRPFS